MRCTFCVTCTSTTFCTISYGCVPMPMPIGGMPIGGMGGIPIGGMPIGGIPIGGMPMPMLMSIPIGGMPKPPANEPIGAPYPVP